MVNVKNRPQTAGLEREDAISNGVSWSKDRPSDPIPGNLCINDNHELELWTGYQWDILR